jgi:hypothetical protein
MPTAISAPSDQRSSRRSEHPRRKSPRRTSSEPRSRGCSSIAGVVTISDGRSSRSGTAHASPFGTKSTAGSFRWVRPAGTSASTCSISFWVASPSAGSLLARHEVRVATLERRVRQAVRYRGAKLAAQASTGLSASEILIGAHRVDRSCFEFVTARVVAALKFGARS